MKVSVGTHPALKKKRNSAKVDRSMSVDVSQLTSAGSSLLGTPPNSNDHQLHDKSLSSLLPTPTSPLNHMLPPLRSHSSLSERRPEKRPHHNRDNHHRRDSEPAASKRPRLLPHQSSLQEDFPREPHHFPTPQHPHDELNKHLLYQPSSRWFGDDIHYRSPSHDHYTQQHHIQDARGLITERSSRCSSYNEGGATFHDNHLPTNYHRRLSDYSEQAGGSRTPPWVAHDINRHKRHRTEDGWMVNNRGFRGQSHLFRNNYRH